MPYLASRGGHAPGHLRELFLTQIENADTDAPWDGLGAVGQEILHGKRAEAWEKQTDRQRWDWLMGQLWNCTDILPSASRSELSFVDPTGGVYTYAQAARALKQAFVQ